MGQRDFIADRPARRTARRSERGQSMIEFAITAPVLLILLLGLIEFGHGLNSYLTVVASARDSARLGAQFGVSDHALLRTVVADETTRLANGPIDNANCGAGQGICITSCVPEGSTGNGSCSGNPVDKWLDVRVCYDHDLLIGLPFVGTGPIDMCSHTTIRIAK